MVEKVIFNQRYELAGSGMLRLIKHLILHRFIPLGNLFGGPGAKCLVMLSLLHYFGGPIYWILINWERPLRFLYNRVKKFK